MDLRTEQVRAKVVENKVSQATPLSSEELLARIAKELGESNFQRHFSGQTKLSLKDGVLEIIVATSLAAQVLSNQFGEQLKRAGGEGVQSVHVRVDRAAFGAPDKPAQAAPRAMPRPRPVVKPQGRFRLDTFIVGTSNRLAHAAATRMADEDGPAAPLFLHGSCGLGKTHLLHAIATRFQERRPTATVRYTTAEAFTNEYITAVKLRKVDGFRKTYRRVDLLCIDDVHFFSNKEATQGELLHTFDAIGMDGARVVMASDEHPRDIQKLSDRLISRFMAGAVVKIDTPDDQLRLRLVKHLATARNLKLDDAATKLLCDRSARSVGSLGGFGGSVREIEGLLIQVEAIHRLLPEIGTADGTIGVGLVRRALGITSDGGPDSTGPAPALRPRRPIAAQTIVSEVCRGLNVDLSDFMGKGRHQRVVLARSLCSYICRRLTTLSFPEIARAMGRTNHSTVITAHRRVERDLKAKPLPLPPELCPNHPGTTLGELNEALSKQIVRAASGL
jgi:chromosomal replication initiator protein